MARPFNRLRRAMFEYGDTYTSLSRSMGCSANHICDLMGSRDGARGDWRLSEICFVMERYSIPPEEMYLYFPPNGNNEYYAGYAAKKEPETVYRLVAVK